jgi:hypothetical protein
MQIRIEILGNRTGNGECLKEVFAAAMKKKGFVSYTELAKVVAEKRGSRVASATHTISRIMLGATSRMTPKNAKDFAEALDIPERELTKFGGAGKYLKGKPIIVEDSTDVSKAVRKLNGQRIITLEDLVKELLYLQHQ